jgi:NAD(P)-dependent dehydrogenase (short-subunit alcohol dehydrogenase family)/acyl dehydratase
VEFDVISPMPDQIPLASEHAFISFTAEDLALFSDASGDRNPLHLSDEYARRTPYGQRVVYGCLGAMACLGHIDLPAGWSATSLEARFHWPMFLGVQYRVETLRKENRWEARLFDGSMVVLSLKVGTKISKVDDLHERAEILTVFERCEAAVPQPESLVPGLAVSGAYGCSSAALAKLVHRWGIVDGLLPRAICWGSYLVGMELPGEPALFSRLVLHFHETPSCLEAMTYQASVSSMDAGFGLLEAKISLMAGASTIASGQYWSYIRSPAPEVEQLDTTGVRPDSLTGRVAVILGSSRGLGAAMERALEMRGAAVFGMARSGNPGDLPRTEVGDAADPAALGRLRERIRKEHGRLDFLICNACPPVLPLYLEPNAAERISAYINQAVSLTLAPLTEFLELLNSSGGCAVIISSIYVERPVKEFPHYIAAKRAVEALAGIASLQYPRVATLIVRPPKLLTAMTNSPLGKSGAASPGQFASLIAKRLETPLEPGKVEIFNSLKEPIPV